MYSDTMQDTSPSKHLQVAIPDYAGIITSPRSDSTSLSSKMKKILSSPKVKRGQSQTSPNKTFGVPLEFLHDRDKTNVPIIVTRISEYLKNNGLQLEGLFRVNGNMKVVDRLKTAFDKCGDADLEEIGDVAAAASLLKMFLRELSEPVIPEDLQPLFISVQDKYCKDKPKAVPLFKELINRMPALNSCLLKYLCEFMLCIASVSDVNKMTPLALAIVFGPNLFRCGDGLNGLRDQAYVNAVLLLMLQEFHELFLKDIEKVADTMTRTPPSKPAPYIEHMRMKKEKESSTEKPARPLPPKISLDEELSTDVSPKRSPKKSNTKKSPRHKSPGHSPRHEINKTPTSRKNPSKKEPTRSTSPVHMPPSPMSKQFVDNTINTTVQEHLFGPGLVTSSIESDCQDEMVPAKTDVSHVYPSVKDRVKKYNVNENEHDSPSKRMKPFDSVKDKAKTYSRSLSSPIETKENITDEDLDFIEESSSHTLDGLTSSRIRPNNRRKPSPRSYSFTSAVETFMDKDENILTSEQTSDNEDSAFSEQEKTKHNSEWSAGQKQLKSHRSLIAPLLKSNSVPAPVSFDEYRQETLKKSNSAEQIDVMSSIPPLDFSRINDEEAHVSPRERYDMAFSEYPMRSPQNSAPSSPRPMEKRHEMWMEKRQDTVPIVEMSPQDLRKRISSLKKIISNFESNFEETNGRKPKPSEKNHIQKYIAELGRAKKQLKELISDYKEKPELLSETAPIGPDLGTAPNLRECLSQDEPSKEQTLESLLKKLEDKRHSSGRPHEMQAMTLEQLKDEKLSVQKALLQYENSHGRPNSKEDKTLMRPLYDRYRKIKRRIATGKIESPSKQSDTGTIFPEVSNTPKRIFDAFENNDEDENLERNLRNIRIPLVAMTPINAKDSNEREDEMGDTFSVTRRFHDTPEPLSPTEDSPRSIDEAVLHDATIGELLDQQRATKRVKKRLGKLLKDYEDDFYSRWSRKMQKEDRLPREAEYREYKLVKAKLRLVDALIAKKSANNTV